MSDQQEQEEQAMPPEQQQHIIQSELPIKPAPGVSPTSKAGYLVEVAPGMFAHSMAKPPKIVLCDVEPSDTPGLCKVVPRQYERMEKVTDELLETLGGISRDTMARLIHGGFVEGIRVAPRIYLLNLHSWFNHLRRCAEQPDFWERQGEKNLKHYSKTLKS